MTYRYSKYLKEINLAGDIFFLNIAYFLTYILIIGDPDTLLGNIYFELQLFFNISWIVSAYIIKIHETDRSASIERVIRKLLNALALYLILIFAFLGIKDGVFFKLFVFYAYCATSIGLAIFNIGFVVFLKYYRKVGYNYRRVIIAGYGKIATDLRKYFNQNPDMGYRFFGYFDDKASNSLIRGRVEDIPCLAKELEIDEIFCILPYLDYRKVSELTTFAEDHFIKIHAVPDYRGVPFKNIQIQLYDMIPVLDFPPQPLDDQINRVIKRSFDIVFSSLFLLLIGSWLIPLVAVLIKRDSKGPVFFKQLRSGINNEPFLCYKFRTMTVNTESDQLQATKSDSRITRIGRFLRKSNIDEVPQFINVLRGEMSVVGPRPHMLKHTEEFHKQVDRFMVRHYVKPGITGLAQSKGFRGETNTFFKLKNRVKLDRFYVENWSILFDMKIIVATVLVMFKGDQNAY